MFSLYDFFLLSFFPSFSYKVGRTADGPEVFVEGLWWDLGTDKDGQ